jgi:hypothetical protein
LFALAIIFSQKIVIDLPMDTTKFQMPDDAVRISVLGFSDRYMLIKVGGIKNFASPLVRDETFCSKFGIQNNDSVCPFLFQNQVRPHDG